MRVQSQFERNICAVAARSAAIMMAAGILLAGCDGKSNSGAPQKAVTESNASQVAPNVTLSASQLSAVKIIPASLHLFHNTREAVGSVTFMQDPSIIQAESTLLSAAATNAVTGKELQRARDLFSTKGVSQRELEQATSDQQTAKSALEAARNALRVLGKTDGEIDNIIAARTIGPSYPQRLGVKWILANASEGDARSFQLGQPVRVSVGAIPGHEFIGKVSEIYAVVDPNTHRVSVRAEVSDPNNELRSGMLADVAVQVQRPIEALSIPVNGAVREGDGTMTAWVTSDRRRFVQRTIETGLRDDGQVQILKGIRQGDLVVSDGAIFLDNMLQAPTGD
jgi:cobalt-zinc-cadmium efflux system membrane fusion protein